MEEWLKGLNADTLHKQRRKNFKGNIVIAENVDEQFQADLVDMQAFQK